MFALFICSERASERASDEQKRDLVKTSAHFWRKMLVKSSVGLTRAKMRVICVVSYPWPSGRTGCLGTLQLQLCHYTMVLEYRDGWEILNPDSDLLGINSDSLWIVWLGREISPRARVLALVLVAHAAHASDVGRRLEESRLEPWSRRAAGPQHVHGSGLSRACARGSGSDPCAATCPWLKQAAQP